MESRAVTGARALHLARQPIVDRAGALVAFELLFRSQAQGPARVVDDRAATNEVIVNAFCELGVDSVLGRHRGFINVDASTLFSGDIELLPRERVVVELLETIEVDEQVVARAAELASAGWTLAVDDVTAVGPVEALLPHVRIVKVDVAATTRDELAALVAALRAWRVQLLAEKVETREQFCGCLDLGFDLFQGYHFARPEILSARKTEPSRAALLRVMTSLAGDAELDEVEQAFREAPELVYNLLRIVNSVRVGLEERVGSLRQAIVLLGRRQLVRWVQVLAYGSCAGAGSPLLQVAATRARLLEQLAAFERPQDREYQERCFMTGVVSLLDALFGRPIAELATSLNMVDEVRDALVARQGPIGRLLAAAEALERGRWGSAEEILGRAGVAAGRDLALAELEAVRWANEVAA